MSRLSRAAATLLISNLAGAALSFVLSALIGRAAGAEGLGVYAAIGAWIFPLSLIVDFGLSMLLTRDLSQHPEQSDHLLRLSLIERLVIGGAVMAALWLFAPLLTNDPLAVAGLRISAPMVIILPMFSSFTSVFKARGSMQPILWLNVGMLATQVALTAWAFASGYGVMAAITLNVLTSAGQLAAAWLIWRRRYRQGTAGDGGKRSALKTLLRRAAPFALAAIFAALQLRVNLIILEASAPIAEAGYYAASSRVVEAARLAPNALFGALLPSLAALTASHIMMNSTFRRVQFGLLLYGAGFALVCTLFAAPIIEMIYGADFTPTAPALILLGWALLFSLQRGAKTLYWYALGYDHYINVCNLLVLLVQIGFSLLLIPRWGASGGAAAYLAAEFFGMIALWRRWHLPLANRHPKHYATAHQP